MTGTATSSSSSPWRLTDSQKLDKLLNGFDSLQSQYNHIKQDHIVLLEECKQLREENKRLRQALQLMSTNCGKDLEQFEVLLAEIEELKDTVAQGKAVLETYKGSLEERNSQLSTTMNALKQEKAKKCSCLSCRFIAWFSRR